jgi:hypothetical protein
MFGNRLGPDSAYRFAKSEEVTSKIDSINPSQLKVVMQLIIQELD